MALLSRAPRAASVVALQPSILLVTSREALEVVAAERPQVASELAAHCRRRMVANLVRTSAVLRSVDRHERGPLVERFETRVFNKGEYLIQAGAPVEGLHLIASGEVAVVANHADGSLLVATLGAGDTAGEVALVLRRNASADVVAAHPTVSLFLPRQDFLTLVRDHPLILHALYLLAVRRDEETSSVLQDDSPAEEVADEEFVLV
jgi:CRP-like cAMP-binding protein